MQNWLAPIVCERRAYHTRSSRGVSARRTFATVHTQGEQLYLEIVGEHGISKNLPTITQDQSKRYIATRGESVSTYPRRPKAEALSNTVDVVEHLRDPTDQAPTHGTSAIFTRTTR